MRSKPQFSVKVRPSKDKKDKDIQLNKALKKWKRLYQEFQIKEELVKRQQFVKPSAVKRKMMNDTIRNNKIEVQKQKDNE